MSSITTSGQIPESTAAEPSYLTAKKGLMSWIITVDHKRIGLMYLGSILTMFLIGGLFALGVRTELFTPEGNLTGDQYNRLFTLHGAIMVFLVLVPSIPASIGNIILPLMLGAKDVAFPKLNLASYHLYVLGALFFIYTLVSGGIDTGWTFYTPYSTDSSSSVISALTGAFILGFSSIFTGLNFMVTIHKMRAPGMTWTKMPLFVWGLYATSLIQVLATPVIGITLMLAFMERMTGIGIFDPALGGDPVLFQHFFWFYSHPVVYVMILPSFGIISDVVAVHSRKHIFGYMAIAASSVSIAAIGFLVWGHHMFTSGQSELMNTIFSLITFGVAVPTAIKVCSWIATMYKGSIVLNTPMLYTLVFLWVFAIGGLTGLYLSTLATDIHLHDTYFVVAHFHYTMQGGTLLGFIAGIYHWWPKFTGKMFDDNLGRLSAILVFIGFSGTFIPQFVMGAQGMPRRYHEYLPQFEMYHQMSTIGSYILGAGFFLTAYVLMKSITSGEKAPQNPWGAMSMEWETASPPIEHNFHGQPVCKHGPYDFPEIDHSQATSH